MCDSRQPPFLSHSGSCPAPHGAWEPWCIPTGPVDAGHRPARRHRHRRFTGDRRRVKVLVNRRVRPPAVGSPERRPVYAHIQGVEQMLLSEEIYYKYISQREEEQQYITVGTVRMFIGTRAKH